MKIKIDTIGIEFTFDVLEKSSKRLKVYRELYGWKSASNNGKYLYLKDGILSSIKYLKPTKSTIIILRKDAKSVRKFFKEKRVIFNEKIVLLNKTEAKDLGLKFDNNLNKFYEELKGNENLFFSIDI
jgi:hypothetical protein